MLTAPTILVLTNRTADRSLFMALFSVFGYRGVFVPGAEEAIERIIAGIRYDLILTGLNLHGMCGEDFLAALQALDVDTPVVAVTACAMSGDRERLLEQGFADYLSKPFEREELRGVIERNLSKSPPRNADEAQGGGRVGGALGGVA